MREPHFSCFIYRTYNGEREIIGHELFHNYESAVMYGEDSCQDLTRCFKKGSKYTYTVLPYKVTHPLQSYKYKLLALKDLLQKSLCIINKILTQSQEEYENEHK